MAAPQAAEAQGFGVSIYSGSPYGGGGYYGSPYGGGYSSYRSYSSFYGNPYTFRNSYYGGYGGGYPGSRHATPRRRETHPPGSLGIASWSRGRFEYA